MLFERAEELGRLIGQTNEAKALRRAEESLRSDETARAQLEKMQTLARSLDQLMASYRTPGSEVSWRGALPAASRERLVAMGVGFGEHETLNVPEGRPELLYAAIDELRDAGLELAGVREQGIDLEGVYRRIVEGGV